MAENQGNNRSDGNRPDQGRNQGTQDQKDNRGNQRGTVNNPSGETRGKNTGDYNPNSPTGQNIPGRDPNRNDDPQKRNTPEVPNREEKHETKIPKAEDETETYGNFDTDDSAASQ